MNELAVIGKAIMDAEVVEEEIISITSHELIVVIEAAKTVLGQLRCLEVNHFSMSLLESAIFKLEQCLDK